MKTKNKKMFAYQRKCAGSARTNSTLSANRAPFPLPKSKRAEREGKRRRDESARKEDALGLAEETRFSLSNRVPSVSCGALKSTGGWGEEGKRKRNIFILVRGEFVVLYSILWETIFIISTSHPHTKFRTKSGPNHTWERCDCDDTLRTGHPSWIFHLSLTQDFTTITLSFQHFFTSVTVQHSLKEYESTPISFRRPEGNIFGTVFCG